VFKLKANYGFLAVILPFIWAWGSENNGIPLWSNPEGANTLFEIQLNPEIYRLSNFGEPPQMALWLENMDGSEIKTLWVSSRLARGVWVGKVVCPTALPYWISRRGIEKEGGQPSFLKPLPDGITGATPKAELKVYTSLEPGSTWRYFFELNVSGDYNNAFRASQSNGSPDPDGNGQPSLVYAGIAQAVAGWTDTARVVGRTEQILETPDIIFDLNGMTTSKRVLRAITVTFIEKKE